MNQLPRAMREAMFVEQAYSLIYPFSDGFEDADITHFQAINAIRQQLDVLCGRGMTDVMVVISKALGLRPREGENAMTLCGKFGIKLDTAEHVLMLDEKGIRNIPEDVPSPTMSPRSYRNVPSPTMSPSPKMPSPTYKRPLYFPPSSGPTPPRNNAWETYYDL